MFFLSKRQAREFWQAGDRARDAGDWAQARDAYSKALKLAPNRTGLWVQYGNVLKESGDYAAAESAYRTALVIDPKRADTYVQLGHLMRRWGRWREAERAFTSAIELAPAKAGELQRELNAAQAHRSGNGADHGPVPGGGDIDTALRELSARVKGTAPNLTHFGHRFADYEIAMLNIKSIGYALARALGENLNARTVTWPPQLELASKACTQADLESDWAAFWSRQLNSPVRYHRKVWEFCYIAQALWNAGRLKAGMTGLGFGCGNEPLVGLFAKYGAKILATDLPPQDAGGWDPAKADLAEYRRQYAEVCPDPALRENIDFRPVNMREIPDELHAKFDFCWSACALEHLGSIEDGLKFIEASLRTLKPGGVAVHTTEFNIDDDATVDHWATVLFQRKHFTEIANRLQQQGYRVAPLDFNPGDGFLDGFVDIPPWNHQLKRGEPDAHLKLSLDGFICTSFGLSVFAPGR